MKILRTAVRLYLTGSLYWCRFLQRSEHMEPAENICLTSLGIYTLENEDGVNRFTDELKPKLVEQLDGDTIIILSLERRAMLVMLDSCFELRVARKPRLERKVEKNGIQINVSQLSDGEKCTMALFGDLARRLAILRNINKN